MSALTYFYIASLALATLTGLVKFRNGWPAHLKVIVLLLPYVLLVEIGVVFFRNLVKDGNVLPLYNIIMLIEFLVYAYFFKSIITFRLVKRFLSGFLFLFPVFWFITVFFIFNITAWNSYVFLLGGTITVICALIYCYQLLTSLEDMAIGQHNEFWIALGIIIFYACQVPFMGIYNFLQVNYPALIIKFQMGLQITNIVMYSLFTYAFLCKKINIMKYT